MMDKSWMSLSRMEAGYIEGVDSFISFATKHGVDPVRFICPCIKCHFSRSYDVSVVREHLICDGINSDYKVWVWHGEKQEPFEGVLVLILGNILIDSPNYSPELRRNIEAMGGVRYMFLTHKHLIADHKEWAEALNCERIIHSLEVQETTAGVEMKLEGESPWKLYDDVDVIFTPGHSEADVYTDKSGGCVALLANTDDKNDATVQFRNTTYKLPAWSVSILPDCKNVAFNTAKVTSLNPEDLKAYIKHYFEKGNLILSFKR